MPKQKVYNKEKLKDVEYNNFLLLLERKYRKVLEGFEIYPSVSYTILHVIYFYNQFFFSYWIYIDIYTHFYVK